MADLEAGTAASASKIKLPSNVDLVTPGNVTIARIVEIKIEVLETPAVAEGATAAAEGAAAATAAGGAAPAAAAGAKAATPAAGAAPAAKPDAKKPGK